MVHAYNKPAKESEKKYNKLIRCHENALLRYSKNDPNAKRTDPSKYDAIINSSFAS